MLYLLNFYNPNQVFCLFKEHIFKKNIEGNESFSGVVVEFEGNVLGLVVYEKKLYFIKENNYYEINFDNIITTHKFEENNILFKLEINNNLVFEHKYEDKVSTQDLLLGETQEDIDFFTYLNEVLSSKESINKFIKGFSLGEECKTL